MVIMQNASRFRITTNLNKRNLDQIEYRVDKRIHTSHTINDTPRHGLTVSTLKPRMEQKTIKKTS